MSIIYKVISNDAGAFLAVGASETILLSTDRGISWWEPITQPNIGEDLYGAAFGEILDGDDMQMRFIAVGASGVILISEINGVSNWSAVNSGVIENLRDIAFTGSGFIAVGDGGKMLSSFDFGETWEEEVSGTHEDLFSITIEDDIYTIVGDNGTIIVGSVSAVELDVSVSEAMTVSGSLVSKGTFGKSVTETVDGYGDSGSRRAGMVVEFTIGGTVETGDQYTITINGTDYTYTVGAGDSTTDDIASGLAALVDAGTNISSEANGSVVTVLSSGDEPVDFSYSTSTANGGGTADETITPNVVQEATSQKVTATLSGTYENADSFTVTLDGTPYTVVAGTDGASLTELATALAALIDAETDYVASANGAVVTIEAIDPNNQFTYSGSAVNGGATADEGVTMALARSADEGFGVTAYETIAESQVCTDGYDLLGYYNETIRETAQQFGLFVSTGIFKDVLLNMISPTDDAERIVAVIGEIVESLTASHILNVVETETIKETFRVLSSGTTGGSTIHLLKTETVSIKGTLIGAYSRLVVDAITSTDTAKGLFSRGIRIVERIVSSGILASHLDAVDVVAEAMAMAESVWAGLGFDVTDGVAATDSYSSKVMGYALALETATMVETASGSGLIGIPVSETVNLDSELSASAIFQSLLSEGVMFSISFGMDGISYEGWVMNAKSFGVWEYQNYPFDSMCWWQGVPLGINQNGIYRLTGDTDNGEYIAAKLLTGQSNLGTSNLKTIPAIYLGFRANGDILLKTITREEVVRWYTIRSSADGLHERRVKCGRGIKSTYWAIEIENIDGADFDLDVLELYPVISSRKMGG